MALVIPRVNMLYISLGHEEYAGILHLQLLVHSGGYFLGLAHSTCFSVFITEKLFPSVKFQYSSLY